MFFYQIDQSDFRPNMHDRHKYLILVQSQSIFYMHKAAMMVDHCIQHEQNPLNQLRYIIRKIQHLWYNQHKCYMLTQSQCIFCMHLDQDPIVVYCHTKYEQNQPIIFWNIETNIKFKKNIDIITQIWHIAKLYFTCGGSTWIADYCTKYEQNQPFLPWDITTNTQHVWKTGHNY